MATVKDAKRETPIREKLLRMLVAETAANRQALLQLAIEVRELATVIREKPEYRKR